LRPQIFNLFLDQLEHEVGWEAVDVPFVRLIQNLCRDPIKFGNVGVEDDVFAAEADDEGGRVARG
jgi:hypothetical protein